MLTCSHRVPQPCRAVRTGYAYRPPEVRSPYVPEVQGSLPREGNTVRAPYACQPRAYLVPYETALARTVPCGAPQAARARPMANATKTVSTRFQP